MLPDVLVKPVFQHFGSQNMTHFESDLSSLKQKLLLMAGHAETAVNDAVRGLMEKDSARCLAVADADDRLDGLEMEIDEDALRLLTKAPLAQQLRLITVAMKISRDLERIGDEATTISRRGVELMGEAQLKPYVDIPRMAQLALAMLKDALDAFVNGDTAKARGVIPRDKEVDALNRQLHRELAGYMAENPWAIPQSLNLMTVSKALERIADHAKNIAEEAVYLYEAQDIRHPAVAT